MLKEIIDMLQLDDHFGQSENIEIAKGKYELPKTIKTAKRQLKREIKWRLRKK